jgi:hypothetical protein
VTGDGQRKEDWDTQTKYEEEQRKVQGEERRTQAQQVGVPRSEKRRVSHLGLSRCHHGARRREHDACSGGWLGCYARA